MKGEAEKKDQEISWAFLDCVQNEIRVDFSIMYFILGELKVAHPSKVD